MANQRQPAILFIFITLLIDVIGIGLIIPGLPFLIEELTGSNNSDASRIGGLLIALYAIFQFLFSPVLGNLSDRFGRRPVLLLSLLGLGFDYILMAMAPTISWLFAGRILSGILGASFTTGTAYIADVSAPEKRAQNFGLVGVAFGVGFIIGPLIGGLLTEHMGTRAPFLAAATLSLLNFLYGLLILPESLPEEKRRPFDWKRANPFGAFRQLRKYPVISGLVLTLILIYLASHAVQSTWSFFTSGEIGWNGNQIGISLAVVGVLVAAIQGGLIRVINPWLGSKKSIYLGMAFYGLGLLLFSFANAGWMMYVFLIPYCLGGICGPALQGVMSSQVPDNEQGELQGALTALVSLTSFFGPLMMTNLYATFSDEHAPIHFPGAAFLAGSILTVLALWMAYRTLESRHLG